MTEDETKTAMIAGARMERERISAIVALDEARGREAAALELALQTSMSASAARAVLARLPKASAAPSLGRACDSPIGLALGGNDLPSASGVMSPEEVAASVNKQSGASHD